MAVKQGRNKERLIMTQFIQQTSGNKRRSLWLKLIRITITGVEMQNHWTYDI